MAAQSEAQFGLAKSLLYSVVLIGLSLGLTEGALRVWAHYLRSDVQHFDTATGTFILIPGEHRGAMGGDKKVNRHGFVGAELKPAGPDLWRIVALGDSCTFGAGDDVHTYPAMLDSLLREREVPGLRYEVVNAGISGLSSRLALNRLRSVVPPLEPDVVTIYLGWNDLMKTDPIGGEVNPRIQSLAAALNELWLVKGLRKLLFFHVRPLLRDPRTGPESRSGLFADYKPVEFGETLVEIVAEVRSMGARPALVTLPTAVRMDMTAADLRRARIIFPYFASAYAVGDFLDLLESYNRTIREVAERENAPLFDLVPVFERLSNPTHYFHDTMHTRARGMRLIAADLLAALDREGLLSPSEPTLQAAGLAGQP